MLIGNDESSNLRRATIVTIHNEEPNPVVFQSQAIQDQWIMRCHQNLARRIALDQPNAHGLNEALCEERIQAMVGVVHREELRGIRMKAKDRYE